MFLCNYVGYGKIYKVFLISLKLWVDFIVILIQQG
jgi:hypothetical protein